MPEQKDYISWFNDLDDDSRVRYKLFFNLFLKWTLLVWLNAIFSFVVAVILYNKTANHNPADILGMICGVFTFVFIYMGLDYDLTTKQSIILRKSVLLKAVTQFAPMIEMMTGLLSTSFIENIGWDNIPFLSSYLITLTDGTLLSITVVLCLFIIKFTTFIIHL